MRYIVYNNNGIAPGYKGLKIPTLKDTIVYCIVSSCLSPTHWKGAFKTLLTI